MKILKHVNFLKFAKNLNNKAIDVSILGTILILMFTSLIAMEIDFFMNTIAKEHMINAISSSQLYALMDAVSDDSVHYNQLILVPGRAESTFRNEIRSKVKTGSNSFYKTIDFANMYVYVNDLDKTRATISTSLTYTPVQFIKSPSDTLFRMGNHDSMKRFETRTRVVSAIYLYR